MFDHHQLNALYKYAVSLTNHSQDAFDLVHSTVEKCIASPSEPTSRMAFAKRTLRNLYIDQYRHNARFPQEQYEELSVLDIDLDMNSLETMTVNSQEVEMIWSSLKSDERELLYLWAVEEFTVQEIADQWQKPKGTLLSKLHRLKTRIKQLSSSTDKVQSS